MAIRREPRRYLTGSSPASPLAPPTVKNIGFLSFGHWTPSPHSQTRSASDALLQSIELAVAAQELGVDGAYFRMHHFARQLASAFPLLAAGGAKTQRIELGTAVIDMRCENPLYMVVGRGRGRPHRRRTPATRDQPRPMFPNPPDLLRLEPVSAGLRERIWWRAATNATAEWAAKPGMNLQSSTLKIDELGQPSGVNGSSGSPLPLMIGSPRSPGLNGATMGFMGRMLPSLSNRIRASTVWRL